jgi:hypothetical protein
MWKKSVLGGYGVVQLESYQGCEIDPISFRSFIMELMGIEKIFTKQNRDRKRQKEYWNKSFIKKNLVPRWKIFNSIIKFLWFSISIYPVNICTTKNKKVYNKTLIVFCLPEKKFIKSATSLFDITTNITKWKLLFCDLFIDSCQWENIDTSFFLDFFLLSFYRFPIFTFPLFFSLVLRIL